jgi:hypothetical protein
MSETRELYKGRNIHVRVEPDGTVQLEIDGKAVPVRGHGGRYATSLAFSWFSTPVDLARKLIDEGLY